MTYTLHSIAEELRQVGHVEYDPTETESKKKKVKNYPPNDDVAKTYYSLVPDDYTCISMFFSINPEAITSKGIRIAEAYPKMFEFCVSLVSKGKITSAEFETVFNKQVADFNDKIVEMKPLDPAIDEMFQVEMSAELSAMTMLSKTFEDLTAQLRAADFIGYAKQDGFKKGITYMIEIMEDRFTVPTTSSVADKSVVPSNVAEDASATKLSPEIKKFFGLYEKIIPSHKAILKKEFKILLASFARCCMIRRLPVAVAGKLQLCQTFIKELPLKPIFDYLGVPVDTGLSIAVL